MIITNKTKEKRAVRFGVADLIIPPLQSVQVPKEQEQEARRAIKSRLWQRFLDEKIFSVDDQKKLTEDDVTVTAKPKAPKELKQSKGRGKVTTPPTISEAMSI